MHAIDATAQRGEPGRGGATKREGGGGESEVMALHSPLVRVLAPSRAALFVSVGSIRPRSSLSVLLRIRPFTRSILAMAGVWMHEG